MAVCVWRFAFGGLHLEVDGFCLVVDGLRLAVGGLLLAIDDFRLAVDSLRLSGWRFALFEVCAVGGLRLAICIWRFGG